MKLKELMADTYSAGKGAVKVSIASTISGYRERYAKLIAAKQILYVIYKFGNKNIIIHFKIPSETVDDFYYDVLLELDGSGGATSFSDCDVKFFSNCPSFVNTYANLYYTHGSGNLIIDKFEKKLPEKVLTDRPNVRNPMGMAIPDKSIYYAVFYLDNIPFEMAINSTNTISKSRLLQSVSSAEKLMVDRKSQQRKLKEFEQEQKRSTDKAFLKKERKVNKKSGINVVKPIKKVKPIAKHRPVKRKK